MSTTMATLFATLLILHSFLHAHAASPPACAVGCAQAAAIIGGCPGLTDTDCLCALPSFAPVTKQCATITCSNADFRVVEAFLDDMCKNTTSTQNPSGTPGTTDTDTRSNPEPSAPERTHTQTRTQTQTLTTIPQTSTSTITSTSTSTTSTSTSHSTLTSTSNSTLTASPTVLSLPPSTQPRSTTVVLVSHPAASATDVPFSGTVTYHHALPRTVWVALVAGVLAAVLA